MGLADGRERERCSGYRICSGFSWGDRSVLLVTARVAHRRDMSTDGVMAGIGLNEAGSREVFTARLGGAGCKLEFERLRHPPLSPEGRRVQGSCGTAHGSLAPLRAALKRRDRYRMAT